MGLHHNAQVMTSFFKSLELSFVGGGDVLLLLCVCVFVVVVLFFVFWGEGGLGFLFVCLLFVLFFVCF